MKRYVTEEGSGEVVAAMEDADLWYTARITFTEVTRALLRLDDPESLTQFAAEWSAFEVIEIDQALVEHASELAHQHGLRSLDALHLAAAALLPRDRTVVVTWDRRLHAACRAEDRETLPRSLD